MSTGSVIDHEELINDTMHDVISLCRRLQHDCVNNWMQVLAELIHQNLDHNYISIGVQIRVAG